jgi:hypothetical protein
MKLWCRISRLFERRTVLGRVLLGSCCILLILLIAGAAWLCSSGESYFSLTRRVPADVLAVEGWIGQDGIRAAAAEFEERGYQYLVATGGLIEEGQNRSNYAEIAERELIQSGIPIDKMIVAPTGQIERQRTYESAVAARQALQRRGIQPNALNVFTLGPHARRSRLVYEKVYRPRTQVGVIAFVPHNYEVEPWWRSKGRTKCLLKEVVGYPFEILLNSGRSSNAPGEAASPNSLLHTVSLDLRRPGGRAQYPSFGQSGAGI